MIQKNFFLSLLVFVSTTVLAQDQSIAPQKDESLSTDQIFLHSGKIIKVIITQMEPHNIIFHYPNESFDEDLGKYAVEKIIYKSGREAEITEKIRIHSENDWHRVIIVEEESKLLGLKRKGDIKSQTALITFRSTANQKLKTEERLKRAAAEMGCPFVFLTREETLVTAERESGNSNTSIWEGKRSRYSRQNMGINTSTETTRTASTQTVKKGIAYCY